MAVRDPNANPRSFYAFHLSRKQVILCDVLFGEETSMRSVCVYLGANSGKSNRLFEAVVNLGQQIAANGYRLVYGGSSQGLMGLLATSVMDCHGSRLLAH